MTERDNGDCRPGEEISEDIGDDFFAMGLNAGVANFFGAGGADFVGGKAVGGGIDEAGQLVPEVVEAVGFEAALEERVLDAHAVILTEFGNFVKTFGFGNVVGDESEHLFVSAAVTGGFGWGWYEDESLIPPV